MIKIQNTNQPTPLNKTTSTAEKHMNGWTPAHTHSQAFHRKRSEGMTTVLDVSLSEGGLSRYVSILYRLG